MKNLKLHPFYFFNLFMALLFTLIFSPNSSNAQLTHNSWAVNLSVDETTPIVSCTPIKATFDIINASDDPVPGVTLRFLLRTNLQFQFLDNPGFVQNSTLVGPGNFLFDNWEMPLTMPGLNDPEEGLLQFCASILQTVGNGSEGFPEVLIQTVLGTDESFAFSGPNIVNDPTFTEIGTGQNSVSTVSTHPDLPPPPGGGGAIGDLLINGTLEIDADYTFSVSMDIHMGTNSTIKVLPGFTLSIIDEVKFKSCQGMWKGIEVMEGGTLIVDGSTVPIGGQGLIISDAITAINAHNNTDISVTKAIFTDNYVGISTVANPGGNNIVMNLTDNVFEASALKAPYVGFTAFAGLQMNDVSTVVNAQGNSYKDLLFGIYGNKSNINSGSGRYENTSTGIYMTGNGETLTQTDGGFKNCTSGISIYDQNVDISDNLMEDVTFGITARNMTSNQYNVNNNEIHAERIGISIKQTNSPGDDFVSENQIFIDGHSSEGTGIVAEFWHTGKIEDNIVVLEDGRFGIFSNQNTWTEYLDNSINLLNSNAEEGFTILNSFIVKVSGNAVYGAGNTAQIGMRVSSSPLTRADCNCFNNLDVGAFFFDNSSPTRLRGNMFGEHLSFGLQLGDQGGLTGFIGPQTNRGNMWTQDFREGQFGAANFAMTEAELIESQFILHEAAITPFHPPVLAPNVFNGASTWFQVIEGGAPNSCGGDIATLSCPEPSGAGPSEDPQEISQSDLDLINGSFQATLYPAAQEWKAKQHLYERLSSNPSLLEQESIVAEFFDYESNSSIGQLHQINQRIDEALELDEATNEQLRFYYKEIKSKMAQQQKLNKHLLNGDGAKKAEDLMAQQNEVRRDLYKMSKRNKQLQQAIGANLQNELKGILAENRAISVTKKYEKNEKAVNLIYLETLINKGDLTEKQKETLAEIANQCPLEGGDAVYRARAILGHSRSYDDVALCQPKTEATNQPLIVEQYSKFHVAPNPANDYLNIHTGEALNIESMIYIYNAFGMLVGKETLPAQTSSLSMSTSTLPAGTYYLTVVADGQRVQASNFVIAR